MNAIRLLFCITIFIYLSMLSGVYAHSWYDPWCCSDKDCGPAKVYYTMDGKMVIDKDGVTTLTDQYTIKKPSLDEKTHACVLNKRVRCVYLPTGV